MWPDSASHIPNHLVVEDTSRGRTHHGPALKVTVDVTGWRVVRRVIRHLTEKACVSMTFFVILHFWLQIALITVSGSSDQKKLSTPSNSKQNCMENHPKKYLLEIQRFGSPGFGLKLRCQDPIRPHTHTQLQAKSWRAKPLNFQKISFGVVPHTILLGIRGVTKFFWSIDPL